MKQEDKELLLRDLCARTPYGVKALCTEINAKKSYNIEGVGVHCRDIPIVYLRNQSLINMPIMYVRPYLFPLSSMTEEQKEEYGKCYDIDLANSAKNLYNRLDGKDTINGYPMYNHIDWCNKNHFDYRGLIEKSLALDATGLSIYKEETK